MKIYTKTGDQGDTGLFGGARVSKASLRVDVYGDVDELNSVLGLVRTERFDAGVDALLSRVQSRLFDLGAELATAPNSKVELEHAIDRAEGELSPLKTFILPGGCRSAAFLHLARTVCRRAERKLVALSSQEPIRAECVRYLNRLSDALFVLARLANQRAGVRDEPWVGAGRNA